MKNLIYGALLTIGLTGCQNNPPQSEAYNFKLDDLAVSYRVQDNNCLLSFENPTYSILILDNGCDQVLDEVLASRRFTRTDVEKMGNIQEYDNLLNRAKKQATPEQKVESFKSGLQDFL
ncbi:MAG: hypothetical protein Q8Q01_03240 [archaeon]|nr:hypothetical protein [archaeon]